MEYEIRPASSFKLGFKEIWEYRELFYFFTWRDIKVRYKQTVLGIAWAVLQPVIMTVVFTLFFDRALKISSGSLPYPLFVFAGMLVWGLFSSGLTNSGNSMITASNIIKKIYFPRLIIPVSSILAAIVDFLISLVILLVMMVYFGYSHQILATILVLPLVLLFTLLPLTGAGCFLSALNVKYRDFRYVIPFLIQVLFFLTPIIYPVHFFQNELIQQVYQFHPIATAIEMLRDALAGSFPPANMLLASLISSLIIFFIGIYYFRKTEYYFADLA